MKKSIAIVLAIIMALSLCACGETASREEEHPEQTELVQDETENAGRAWEQERFYDRAVLLLHKNAPVAYQLFYEAGDYEDAQSYLENFQYCLLWETNDAGVYAYQYDANGNCIAKIGSNKSEYFYVYDDAGRLIREGTEDRWDTEYEYNENGTLKRTKDFVSYTNSAKNPNYIYTEYNSFGYPVKLENESDCITWEFTYDCGEDGVIHSVQCAMEAYDNALDYTFNLDEFDGRIELCHGAKDKVLTFRSVSEDGTEIRMYGLSYVNSEIVLEELSYTKVDSHGNPVMLTTRNLVNVKYTLRYENTYNGRGDLIKVEQSSDKSNDIITYTYAYGYTYPEAAVVAAIRNTEDSTDSSDASTHTNQYGPETTQCAHNGCTDYIAPSGDTNCCTTHSWMCLRCDGYIDEGAIYCLTCLERMLASGNAFTNKFGTPTTKCAHSGCNKYIASSGDTNCCTTHSNNCLNCGCYIDGDAMYCITCLTS